MKSIILHNEDNSVRVEYKTDFAPGSDNFTILDILGENTASKTLGLQFKREKQSLNDFIAFAEDKELALVISTNSSSQEIVALPEGEGEGEGEGD